MKDTAMLLKNLGRMCYSGSMGNVGYCPFFQEKEKGMQGCEWCTKFLMKYPERAEEIINQWAEKHPVRTNQSMFLRHYPDPTFDFEGILLIDPCQIESSLKTQDPDGRCSTVIGGCRQCRREYWKTEVLENEL